MNIVVNKTDTVLLFWNLHVGGKKGSNHEQINNQIDGL